MVGGCDLVCAGAPEGAGRVACSADPAVGAPSLWAEEGRLRPFISHVVPLADVKEAFRMMWDRQVTGRICLAPDGEDVATSTAGPPPPAAAAAAATSVPRSRL